MQTKWVLVQTEKTESTEKIDRKIQFGNVLAVSLEVSIF